MNNLSSFTDHELVVLLGKSDYAGFAEIFDRYHHLLLNHAYNKLRNKEEANGVIQDVFIKLWHLRGEVDIQDLSGHLYAMVRDGIFSLFYQKQADIGYGKASDYFRSDGLLSDQFSKGKRQLNEIVNS